MAKARGKSTKTAKAKPTKAASKVAKPARGPAGKTATRKAGPPPGWVDAGKGYELGIRDGKVVARKDGKELSSIPKPIKDGPVADRLDSAVEVLDEHALQCTTTVETWMLRSVPVPRGVLEAG